MTRNKNNARKKDARSQAAETGVSYVQARREVAPTAQTEQAAPAVTSPWRDLDSQPNITRDLGLLPVQPEEPTRAGRHFITLGTWKSGGPVPPRHPRRSTFTPEFLELVRSSLEPPTLITKHEVRQDEPTEPIRPSSLGGGEVKTHAVVQLPPAAHLGAARAGARHLEADPERLRAAIERVSGRFDTIIIDVPPEDPERPLALPWPGRRSPDRAQVELALAHLLRLARESGHITSPSLETD